MRHDEESYARAARRLKPGHGLKHFLVLGIEISLRIPPLGRVAGEKVRERQHPGRGELQRRGRRLGGRREGGGGRRGEGGGRQGAQGVDETEDEANEQGRARGQANTVASPRRSSVASSRKDHPSLCGFLLCAVANLARAVRGVSIVAGLILL